MNLSEALDTALPEIPSARIARGRPPLLDPNLIVRHDMQDGEPVVAVLKRDKGQFFRIPAFFWNLATLFDGARSFDEIAGLYSQQSGQAYTSEDVREFSDAMEEAGLWYKTPQEKNIALSQKLMAQRGRRAERKSKIDLAHIGFSAWDPDRFLTWVDRNAGKLIYSPWCVLSMVLLFLFEATVFIGHWGTIGPDAKLYYNFTQKSILDVVQFWLLFLVLGFIHESAHGLTCKHYGGQVHSMGLLLIYLMPAFYCDVTEVWISATKIQRLATIIAGVWIEMVVCGFGMIIWLNTQAGEWLHDFAYQLILITGIAVIAINLNPLIKLDGYFFLTEAIGIPDLKERSTSFLSGWFQKYILGLQVEAPIVARRRAPFLAIYALLSGAYSYMVLFVVVRFCYNVTSTWFADFAIIPAGVLAFLVFRSRLRALRNVVSKLWTQHFGPENPRRWLHLGMAIALVVLLFVPFWRDRENAWFVIEPSRADTLHSAVPGRVMEVFARQGEVVRAGQPLLRLNSPFADSMYASADADRGNARYGTVTAELQGKSIGGAAAQQAASQRSSRLATEAHSSLLISAPGDGTVLTQDPISLLGKNIDSGQSLLDLASAGPRIVRLYIPSSELDRIPSGANVALSLPGRFSMVRLTLAPLAGEAVELPSGLIAKQDYKGIKLPVFYCARMTLPISAGSPPFGLSGHAKIFGARRSLAGRFLAAILDRVKAHAW